MESLVHRENLEAIFGRSSVADWTANVLDYAINNIEGGIDLAKDIAERNVHMPTNKAISNQWPLYFSNSFLIIERQRRLYGFKIIIDTDIAFNFTSFSPLYVEWEYEDSWSGEDAIPLLELEFKHRTHTKRYNIPLHFIIKNFPLIYKTTGYIHKIPCITDSGYYKDYIGITQRHWLTRFNEHLTSAEKGSFLLFHETLRNYFLGQHDLREKLVFQSNLELVNASFEESMLWEEKMVDQYSLSPQGLNMLPGGYKGLKFLHSLGLIKRKHERVLYNIDEAKEKFASKLNREEGRKNPKLAELWKTNQYYMKQLEAQPRWLKLGQIEIIRSMDELGYTQKEIQMATRASESQVENLLNGKTFTRIH